MEDCSDQCGGERGDVASLSAQKGKRVAYCAASGEGGKRAHPILALGFVGRNSSTFLERKRKGDFSFGDRSSGGLSTVALFSWGGILCHLGLLVSSGDLFLLPADSLASLSVVIFLLTWRKRLSCLFCSLREFFLFLLTTFGL